MTSADVTLGPLRAEHAPAMFRWMCDPAIAANLGLRTEPSLEKSRDFVARAAADDTVQARAILVDGVHVGNVVLDQIDRYASKARLSIYVGEPSARGRGVGRRALTAILALAFNELGLNKVWLTVHTRNTAAITAYAAAGFRVEGVHREEFLLDGTRVDELYMGCLASEHPTRAASRH